jgi:hypothetical protein
MHRRSVVSGAALGLLGLLTACGGGEQDVEPVDGPIDGTGEHIHGLTSLPQTTGWDLAQLAMATPGVAFEVQVRLGSAPCAGVAVQVFDVHGALLDSGTTDASGRYAAPRDGRCFLHAVAQVAGVGTLHGFELNTVGKPHPVVDVNLLPTLLHRLQERHPLTPASADFLVKTYLGIDIGRLLSDEESIGAELNQEAMRLDWVASGLALDAYIERTVDEMLRALDRGLSAPESSMYRARLQSLSAPPDCSKLPEYEGGWDEAWENETLAVIKRLVKNHWAAATKAVVSFALKKIASKTGVPVIGPVGEAILNQLLPGQPNPTQIALNEIQQQLRVITSALQKVLERLDIADFNRSFDAVRGVFNKFDAIASDMAETQSYYTRNKLPTDDNFNALVITRCEQLFALETELTEAENRFLGLKAFAGAGVLNRWHQVFIGQPFYTAVVQQQYMDLLNYYVNWMCRVYAYLINAHTAYAETKGLPVNKVRLDQLGEQLAAKLTLVEAMRPQYLMSEKQVFDVQHGLVWVGRCNHSTSYRSFLPDDYNDGHYSSSKLPTIEKMRYEEDNPCRERMLGSPVTDSSIREDLVKAFAWRLPNRVDLQNSFGKRIHEKYGGKFNLNTFGHDFYLPSTFALFEPDGKPARAIVRDGIHSERVRVSRGVIRYYLWLYVFHFEHLGVGSKPNHPSYKNFSFYHFPVATVPFDTMYKYLPWKVYEAALAPKPAA